MSCRYPVLMKWKNISLPENDRKRLGTSLNIKANVFKSLVQLWGRCAFEMTLYTLQYYYLQNVGLYWKILSKLPKLKALHIFFQLLYSHSIALVSNFNFSFISFLLLLLFGLLRAFWLHWSSWQFFVQWRRERWGNFQNFYPFVAL